MSDRPNIFDYATSELSQDAFFAWLLEWAEDKYKQVEDGKLHSCAVNLLKAFFDKYYTDFHSSLGVSFGHLEGIKDFSSVRKIQSVDVNRQENNIDLLVTIETDKVDYYLIIEDKTWSREHNQLETYRDSWLNEDVSRKSRTCFIYLKTGTVDDDEKKRVKESKYSLFDLDKIYDLLSKCTSESEIFKSYLSKLETVHSFNMFIKKVKFNGLEERDYKHGVWKNYCYYFYRHKKRSEYGIDKGYYLALDVWLDTGKLDFCFHIIKKLNGKWLDKLEIDITTIAEIKKIFENNEYNGYNYIPDNNYYEKKVPFTNQVDLESKIKTEIEYLFSDK